MKVIVDEVRYVCADSWIVQGFKQGHYPHGPHRGGNGTYLEFASADIEVVAYSDNGRRFVFSIGSDVRRLLGRRKLTYRLYENIRDAAPKYVWLSSHGSGLRVSEESLRDWICLN